MMSVHCSRVECSDSARVVVVGRINGKVAGRSMEKAIRRELSRRIASCGLCADLRIARPTYYSAEKLDSTPMPPKMSPNALRMSARLPRSTDPMFPLLLYVFAHDVFTPSHTLVIP